MIRAAALTRQAGRFVLEVLLPGAAASSVAIVLLWLGVERTGAAVGGGVAAVGVAFAGWWERRRVRGRARIALEDAALRLAAGDAGSRIAWPAHDELRVVVDAANALADTWAAERRGQHERELLLATMLDAAPIAAVLVDRHQRIVYTSRATAGLFGHLGSLIGRDLAEVAAQMAPPLDTALLDDAAEGVLHVANSAEDVVLLRRRRLRVFSSDGTLILLERLTNEVRRSEVTMWKKTTRLLSHELNNSLAPITSLTRSAARLIEAGRGEEAIDALRVVEERSAHLAHFLREYSALARLPPPALEPVEWGVFLAEVLRVVPLRLIGEPPLRPGQLDPSQLEQVLINLVKNAREAGAPEDSIELEVVDLGARGFLLRLRDRGSGFTDEALAEAQLPFWTSKPGGSGIGLALAREVIEAHGGRLSLRNRDGDGAEVVIVLGSRPGTDPAS